ncbi:MAG: hypothetical protein IEMM0001_1961 [bacterium]|nr:MAG: hypothetical protein IEMM0001_1961 [bacterium]
MIIHKLIEAPYRLIQRFYPLERIIEKLGHLFQLNVTNILIDFINR